MINELVEYYRIVKYEDNSIVDTKYHVICSRFIQLYKK